MQFFALFALIGFSAAQYGAPSYDAPASPTYNAPEAPSYNAPEAYEAPAPTYDAPTPTYDAPAPVPAYDAPALPALPSAPWRFQQLPLPSPLIP